MEPHFSPESDSPDWEPTGEELIDFLQSELQIDCAPAEAIAARLVEMDPADIRDGGEPFFESDQYYERSLVWGGNYLDAWTVFVTRVKHRRRFFDAESREILEQILGAPGSEKATTLPAFTVGPNSTSKMLFRARRADSPEEARILLRDAARELGPTPAHRARSGRMNPAGISVFYGALSRETALAEVRPWVGGLVVVAGFEPVRELRLLDLIQLGVGETGSLFDPEYEDRAARLRFLSGFHKLIAQPVQPGDEELEYVPTQIVAEYVASALGFDGLLFRSVQVGGGAPSLYGDEDEAPQRRPLELTERELTAYNVALFGSAGRVQIDEPAAEGPAVTPDLAGDLKYVAKSADAHRVWGVRYQNEIEYIYDPDSSSADSGGLYDFF